MPGYLPLERKTTLIRKLDALYQNPTIMVQVFQFPSWLPKGIERNYETFVEDPSSASKKVREIPRFCTEINEINDHPQKKICASLSTVNIPDNMTYSAEVLKVSRMKEIQGLTKVAALKEFMPGKSWSVTARKDDY